MGQASATVYALICENKNVLASLFSDNKTVPRMNDCLAVACCPVVSNDVIIRYYWQTRQRGLLCKNRYFAMTAEQQTVIGEVGGRVSVCVGGGSISRGRAYRLLGDGQTGRPPRGVKVNKPGRSQARALASHLTRATDSHVTGLANFF